ncbi:MAG: potassium transporter TrkG [Bryobacterales bacterium]
MQGLLNESLIPSSRRTMMHPGPSIASLAGLLTIAGPLYFAIGDALGMPLAPSPEDWFGLQPWLLLASCTAITAGGLAMSPNRQWDQRLAAAGLLGAIVSLAPYLLHSPGIALAVALGSAHLAIEAWISDRPMAIRMRALAPTRLDLAAASARSACMAALAGWLVVWVIGRLTTPGGLGPAMLALLGAWGFVFQWVRLARQTHPRGIWIFRGAALLGVAIVALGWGDFARMAAGMALAPAAALLVIPSRLSRQGTIGRPATILFDRPAYLLVATFASVCLAGTTLLALPSASASGISVGWLDAAFTAVSAVCVTGLIVLDTPTAFSGIGQGFLLLLIQVGGLGIMTYSTAILVLLGRRLGLQREMSWPPRSAPVLAASYTAHSCDCLRSPSLRKGWEQQAWLRCFGARATRWDKRCGAASSLHFRLLQRRVRATNRGLIDPLVLHIASALIILGGISPAVVFALPEVWKRRERRAQVWPRPRRHRLAVGDRHRADRRGQWSRTLGHLGLLDRIHNAWFRPSRCARPASAHSVDIAASNPATFAIMMISMFIGGSPGGTAGGVKTTTAAVLALAVKAAVDGRSETRPSVAPSRSRPCSGPP